MRKPRALRPGDTIGIVAPSSPIPPDELRQGIAILEARGYRVVVGDHVRDTVEQATYLAGEDEARASDINVLFARAHIDAIFCARGGYGAMRLFNLLNRDAIASSPKIFTGYSDITSLHLVLNRWGGYVTFHGFNLSTLLSANATSTDLFWSLIEQAEPYGELPADPDCMRTIVPGTIEGELAGGNLCLLAHACGSQFQPDFRSKIVLIEDVNDAVYHADRYLTQLRNAGALDEAAGFVIGSLTHWQKHEPAPPRNSLEALWRRFFGPLGKPTLCGFPFGHEPNPVTLPLGVRARLDAGARSLSLLESATMQ